MKAGYAGKRTMNTIKKNILIGILEDAVDQIKANAGMTNLGELETEIAALRTAFTADPDTATEANIDAAHDKLIALKVPDVDNMRQLWTQVDSEANP